MASNAVEALDDGAPSKSGRLTPQRYATVLGLSLLIGLFAWHICGNLYWLSVDDHPLLFGDEGAHMSTARQYWRAIFDDGTERTAFQRVDAVIGLPSLRSPLLNILGALFMQVFGRTPSGLAFTSTVCFLFLLAGVYVLVRTFSDGWTALFATFTTSFTPVLFAASRHFIQDFLCATMVVWAVLALIKSDWFRRTGWVAAFGVLNGLGLLAKPTACVFYALPFMAIFAGGVCSCVSLRGRIDLDFQMLKRLALNGFVALSATLATGSYWYVRNLSDLHRAWATHANGKGPFSFSGEFHGLTFPFLMVNAGVFLPMMLIALAGVVVCLASKVHRKGPPTVILLWFLGSCLLLAMLLTKKSMRYAIPAVAPVPIFAALALRAIPFPRVRAVSMTAFAVLLFVQYIPYTFGSYGREWMIMSPWPTYSVDRSVSYSRPQQLLLYSNRLEFDIYPLAAPYRQENFADRVLSALSNDINARQVDPGTLCFYYQHFSPEALNIGGFATQGELYQPEPNPFAISLWRNQQGAKYPFRPVPTSVSSHDDLLAKLDGTDYVIVTTSPGQPGEQVQARTIDGLAGKGFRVIDQFRFGGYGCARMADITTLGRK